MDSLPTDGFYNPADQSSGSVKSDFSNEEPPFFSEPRPYAPAPSSVSLKSNHSMFEHPVFSEPRPYAPVPSSVSLKSNHSMFEHPVFSEPRPYTPAPSSVSLKSNHSMFEHPVFSEPRPYAPVPSSVSLKSNHSMFEHPVFSEPRPYTPAPSSVSLKSNHSMFEHPVFSESRPYAPVPSSVSLKSNHSMFEHPVFSEPSFPDSEEQKPKVEIAFTSQGDSPQNLKIETEIYETSTNKVKRFDALFKQGRTVLTKGVAGIGKTFQAKKYAVDWARKTSEQSKTNFYLDFEALNSLKPQSIEDLLNYGEKFNDADYYMTIILDGLDKCELPLDFKNNKELTDITETAPVDELLTNLLIGNLLPSAQLWILTRPSGENKIPAQYIHTVTECRDKDARVELSQKLKIKIKENVKRGEIETELNEIKPQAQEQKIHYTDLLKRRGVRTLLTTGVPRIGKTFHTDHFRLDWAEGKCSTNTHLVLSIQLSELKRSTNKSLEDLLHKCLNRTVSRGCYYNKYKMIIILDGLDKCELPLDFENNKELTDIRETAPVDELLTNLLTGNLLPSAQLWILTRPSGENKIPTKYIHTVTECRETKERQQKLVSNLNKALTSAFNFEDDLSHPNQKNTEHIRPDRADENGKKIQLTISDLFKEEANGRIRTVLTIGEPDVGKSYLVHKFIHEWATPDSDFPHNLLSTKKGSTLLFPLKFSQFDRLPQTLSFVELLNHVFKETKQCVMSDYNKLNTVFILDGLDDFKVDFSNSDRVSDVNTAAPVSVLLNSLIRGDLLPSAQLWITSRPGAAALLPQDLPHRTTQIREKPDIVSQRNLKEVVVLRFKCVAEGVDRCTSNAASLKDIYTDLYMIKGETGEIYQQSESTLVQLAKNVEVRKEIPIKYQDIFRPSPDRPQAEIRTVLTTGVAGIGKTFASMKYMLDWAEGLSSENIHFTFPLPFRELNLRKDMEYSLEELLHQFFPCMETSEITNYDQYKILFVLDGLDECRLDLSFHHCSKLSDIQQKTPLNNLLMNLIVGNLLPKAQVWITSRPTASLSIPAKKVDRVTEVRGFNNEQKEEYFRKRFNPDLAEKIVLCVKESRSIYVMCSIPVFSFITGNVFESFAQNEHQGAPKTLTGLFIHFLLLQCRQANSKFNEATEEDLKIWNERNVKTILGLSKLAFEQLEKGNLLFTEENLKNYGLDVDEAAVFSGLLTKIKRDECELYPKPFYSFVHLSLQEFLAAFYVSHTFNNEGTNVLSTSSDDSDSDESASLASNESSSYESASSKSASFKSASYDSASDFYKAAVDKALESKNGDWDLFLRFLLGLSLQTNQELLRELLNTPENTEEINKDTIAYIKTKIGTGKADADMNLFHCLNELNDHRLVEEIKKYLNSETNEYEKFSTSKWSALTFVLLTSDEKLDVFDLKTYCKSEKVLLGMMPVVKVAVKALLSWCNLSKVSCSDLSSSILMSPSSNLTELNLSHNELMDAGAEKLSEGLKNFHCKLKILRLAGCRISGKGGSFLVSALESNRSSHLEELDLSYNHPGPEGQRLKTLENDPNVKLKKVCLDHCCEHRLKPGLKKYTVDLTLDGRHKHPRIKVVNQTAKTWERVNQRIPKDSDVSVRHVFCEQELSGFCYWELEWDGTVGIGVSYKGAATKSVLGSDDKSWGVFCSNRPHNCLEFDKCAKQARTQKRPQREVRTFPSQKMAVFLNWEAGTLSYYGVTSGKLTLMATFKVTKFKQTLVPTFWLQSGSVTLCNVI